MTTPATLGEKLAARGGVGLQGPLRRSVLLGALNLVVVIALALLPLWWFVARPENTTTLVGIGFGLVGLWAVIAWRGRPSAAQLSAPHFLLAGDQQGFMSALRLDDMTAVIDGSNLYHFGIAEGLCARALRLIAKHLRDDGYRVVCFFDANIFYTLIANRAFEEGAPYTTYALTQIFGLEYSEIYVVPSGVQADKYILSTLTHLPTSFAVTNDRFRDYGKAYAEVMKGDQWRKGVVVKGNELRMLQHRFQTPIRLGRG